MTEKAEFTPVFEKTLYDEPTDTLVIKRAQDVEPILAENAQARADCPQFGKYKGTLVRVANISVVDVERLQRLGYDLLSHDPAEVRRALLYIQTNEPHHMTVTGKPFAKRMMGDGRWH